MKDLGLDATAGRCRRIPTIRKRSYKGKHRFSRLIRLKVGSRACKVRVIKGGIHSVIAYGAEGLGIPPQRMRAFRMPLGQSMGWQKGGSLDVIFEQHERLEDPQTTTILRHLVTFQRLYKRWPEDHMAELERAWEKAWQKLSNAEHPWRIAYGPMQATICYLIQMGWEASKLKDWQSKLIRASSVESAPAGLS